MSRILRLFAVLLVVTAAACSCDEDEGGGEGGTGGTAATDTDGDGVFDAEDNCPAVANADQANAVHADTPEGDACEDPDADQVFDADDNCPDTVNADQANAVHASSAPGDVCDDPDADAVFDATDNCPDAANTDQADADADGVGDACEGTTDTDGDGVMDDVDNCVDVANPGQEDADGDGDGDACDDDSDNDGVANASDNCPAAANAGQEDADGDGQGDACDTCPAVANAGTDGDADGVDDACDLCPQAADPTNADTDADGLGDACDDDDDGDGVPDATDNCPVVANTDQADFDTDGIGDLCDPDADNDGVDTTADNCPVTPNPGQEDMDTDGVGDACDNCPADANAGQADRDADGSGDACDPQLLLFSIRPGGGWRELDVAFTLTGQAIRDMATVLFVNADVGAACDPAAQPDDCFVAVNLDYSGIDATLSGTVPARATRNQGLYDVIVTNPDGEQAVLQRAWLVSVFPPPTVTDVVPPYAWTGDPTDGILSDKNVSIVGNGFLSTPGVTFISVADPTLDFDALSVSFIDASTLSAIVPTETLRMPAGDYHVFVQNPDRQGAFWLSDPVAGTRGVFEVSPNAPPKITAIDPERSAGPSPLPITITGDNFDAAGVVVELLLADGTVIPVPAALPTVDPAGPDTVVATLAVVPATGLYPVRLTNPDGQFDIFFSFQVTTPASAKFGDVAFGSPLIQGRERHGGTYGFDDFRNGYIFVVGGVDSGGNVLDTVELTQISPFGLPGPFRRPQKLGNVQDPAFDLKAGHVDNLLNAPRAGLTVVRVGKFLYAIGGTTADPNVAGGGLAAVATVERARILGVENTPFIANPTASNGNGLPFGSWYYRVSALCPEGEGLPSREAVAANSGGVITVNWGQVACQDGNPSPAYAIYRSPAADGRANATRLLAVNVAGSSFSDDGAGLFTPAPGRLRGAEVPNATGSALPPGLYTYRVTAVHDDGAGNMVETVAGYSTLVESQQTDAAVGGALHLRWDPIPGATYNLYRSAGPLGAIQPTVRVAQGLAANEHVDDGAAAPDAAAPAPDGTAPLQPGDLSAWQVLPAQLNTAREGAEGLQIVIDADDPANPTGPPILRTFVYVVGGRTTNDTGAASTTLTTVERAEVVAGGELVKLSDGTPGFDTLASALNNARAYLSVVTNQGRDVTPLPPEPPAPPCADFDGDGHENAGCGGDDCNDADATIYPGAPEDCNGVDNDCDGLLGPGEEDVDGDGVRVCEGDCDDANPGIYPGAPEICDDGIDQNCDGQDDLCTCPDADGDGFTDSACDGPDCDDTNPDIHPGAFDTCGDGIDQDCSGADDVCPICTDADADGYFLEAGCSPELDCNDADATIHPNGNDICNDGIDQNCDGRDEICFELPPRGGFAMHTGEPIFIFAVNGSTDGLSGLDQIEGAEVVRDVTQPNFADLSPWTIQVRSGSNTHFSIGGEAVLYNFSATEAYLLEWGGASSHSLGAEPTANNKGRYPFDPAPASPDAFFDRFESTAGGPAEGRSYYLLVRLFGFLWAVGGNEGSGPMDSIAYTSQ